MSNERRQKAAKRLHALGIDHVSQDDTAIPGPCPFAPQRCDPSENTVRINLPALSFKCKSCDASGALEDFLAVSEGDSLDAPSADAMDAEFSETSVSSSLPVATIEAKLVEIEAPLELLQADAIEPPAPREPKRGHAEGVIITVLALVFLGAGLAAAGLSGFANYRAFSASVADPFQSEIWGWTGVIASIISFGGFTFFYWHTANRRVREGLRALVFAIAGVVTSIIGTQMYIAGNSAAAAGQINQAASNRAVLETQITDWRTQLDGIPANTRSVEGLESYIAEVERVGRSHQKPYRDAQNELGLARRRDALQSKIEAANADLLGLGETGVIVTADERPALPSWFFAIMLEIFSSQGTSIGLVALLILYGRRRSG